MRNRTALCNLVDRVSLVSRRFHEISAHHQQVIKHNTNNNEHFVNSRLKSHVKKFSGFSLTQVLSK